VIRDRGRDSVNDFVGSALRTHAIQVINRLRTRLPMTAYDLEPSFGDLEESASGTQTGLVRSFTQ
jgi:hypothetical protein